jgi:hypothetical protein
MLRKLLIAGVSLSALAPPLFAQEAPASGPAANTAEQPVEGEIVVTAQRRA